MTSPTCKSLTVAAATGGVAAEGPTAHPHGLRHRPRPPPQHRPHHCIGSRSRLLTRSFPMSPHPPPTANVWPLGETRPSPNSKNPAGSLLTAFSKRDLSVGAFLQHTPRSPCAPLRLCCRILRGALDMHTQNKCRACGLHGVRHTYAHISFNFFFSLQ